MNRNRDIVWSTAIVLIVAVAVWVLISPRFPVRLGLDLQGGLQVLLEADVPQDQVITSDDMNTARQIVDRRVNAIGVVEPLVQVEGTRRILVELPGIEDPQEALSLIQETALLEFVDTGNQPLPEGLCIRTTLNDGPSRCEAADGNGGVGQEPPTFPTILTGAGLREARAASDNFGQYFVEFKLTEEGGKVFAKHTAANQGKYLTIVLDKQVISSPTISAVIEDQGTISGRFTLEEAQRLATQLQYGSLPVPLRIESTRQIGATLGEQSIDASIRAGAIGVIVVLLFMLIYYRLPGLLADIALIIYVLLSFAIFKGVGVTLTLPAIAGFLLSTGMAVDANVLVFERIKEEMRKGAYLGDAIETGFSRAWNSIRDSNVATLVICFILWSFGRNFGASTVEGFAVTLAIGVFVSMFTAVLVTRTLVRVFLSRNANRLQNHKGLLGLSTRQDKSTRSFVYHIIENRRRYFLFSAILLTLGLAAMIVSVALTGSPFRVGVDFRSGTRFEVQFQTPVEENEIREVFARYGITSPAVIALRGEGLENAWQIRGEFVAPEVAQSILASLNEVAPLVENTAQVTSVSAAVGNEVTRAAIIAVLFSSVVILIYIVIVFRQVPNTFRYGTTAVVALLHDLFIIMGFASLTGLVLGWEIDALFLTAILTIAGFSLQDTIVLFDRMRENIARRPFEKLETLANRSIVETIHRSLVTQLNAMFVMVAILLFGGLSIRPFIATLFFGLLLGTYSSIFIAVPLLVTWEERVSARLRTA
ncbi:MAG TPA: protein translocase subunit SecD [Promineifilum sp.]|nr:protein translocase subunit SecD [Promineifilum sp.]HNS39217.1 protein translocase subunit SecD [Promineifilum sp.]